MSENILKESIEILITRADFFLNLTMEHIAISLTSISIATILGLLLAIFVSEYRQFAKYILSFINFLYLIPSISLLGLLIPFSGIGNKSAIIALCIYALLPMVRNSYTALINIDSKILDAATAMGSSKFELIYKIKIPLALSVIISSIRNMIVMTIALAGIAAFIGAGGLGVAIYRGITTNNQALIVAGSLLIALLALIFDFLVALIEKRVSLEYKIKKRNKLKNPFYKLNKTILLLILTLIVLFCAYMLFYKNKDSIHIVSKPMTEQYILAHILKALIEQDLGVNVNLTLGVGGGSANIFAGMQNNDFDLYVEYSGTIWSAILKKDGIYNESKFRELKDEFENNFNMKLISPYGFNNTFALVVHKDITNKYNLKTYSDLIKVSQNLNFGAEYDFFEREDGLSGLKKAYNMDFKKTFDLDIGLKYDALKNKKVDVINAFSTDARLSDDDFVMLSDDKNFYPSYKAINIARDEVLKKYPKLLDTLQKLQSIINDSTMQKLNAKVELEKLEPKAVGIEFLKEKKLLKD
ncbi:MAG: ABC transporter permease/substrate-binding protein [Helicobacteraceae bacterium]|nr:ABC transporter permease/substrate-binding protein [Helicobacteraceae bacterium]